MITNKHFKDWMERLDHELYIQEGLHLSEVPEFDFWLYYNNDWPPERAIEQFFKYPDDLRV